MEIKILDNLYKIFVVDPSLVNLKHPVWLKEDSIGCSSIYHSDYQNAVSSYDH